MSLESAPSLLPPATDHLECRDNLEFMAGLPDQSMQLVVTSPPYNLGKSYEERSSMADYLAGQARVVDECVRLLSPTGSLCWQAGHHVHNGEVFPLDLLMYPLFIAHGLKLRNRIIWHYEHGLHCTKRLSGRHETILWWTKTTNYHFDVDPIRVPSKYPGKRHFKGPRIGQLSGNPLGKNPGDVWAIPNVKSNHVEKLDHPCQYPVELVERLVLSMTRPGENVFDPYLGVGASAIAALRHGRNAYGCDVVPEYVTIAHERVRRLREGTLPTRPMNKPVLIPTK